MYENALLPLFHFKKKKNVLTLYCFITLIDLFLGVMPVFFLGLTIYPIIWGHSTEPEVGVRRFSLGDSYIYGGPETMDSNFTIY